MAQTPLKKCPQCGAVAYMQAAQCQNCGRVFQTTNPANNNQTQVIQQGGPQIPQQVPPGNFSGQQISPSGVDYIQVFPGTHSLLLPIVLHFLLCGLGAVYNRQFGKGASVMVVWMSMGVGFWRLAALPEGAGTGLSVAIFLAAPVLWLASLVDTVMIADKLNKGYQIGRWQSF